MIKLNSEIHLKPILSKLKSINKKELLSNIIIILETLNICILLFYFGSSEKNYVILISFVIAILLIVTKIFVYKEKIEITLVDCVIFLFPFTYMIAIFAKKTATLPSSIEAVIHAFALLANYFVIRNVNKKDKLLKYLSTMIIVTNIIYIIIGIDERSSIVITNFLKKVMNITISIQEKNRFSSVISYVNAGTVFMLVAYFMSIYKYIKCKKNITRNIALGISNIFLPFVILTYSKIIIVITVAIILILFYIAAKKKKIKEFKLLNLVIENIVALFVILVGYSKLINYNKYAIWIFFAIYLIIYVVYKIFYNKFIEQKISNLNLKINKRKIIHVIIVISVAIITILSVDLICGNPLQINNNNKSRNVYYYSINQELQYNINFKYN